MPLYECKCENCGYVHQELMRHRELVPFVESLDNGDYSHNVHYEDGRVDICGTFRYKMSIPNVHSASGDYPFDTSPWLLPPKIVDGKAVPNIVTVNNRSEYKALLKKNGLIEPETGSDRGTMYDDRVVKVNNDLDVDEDMKMYNHMLRNPLDRKKVIRDSIAKSRSLLNATA